MLYSYTPTDIFSYLSERVIGQPDVLRVIAIALYTHINELKGANILLIGNSGTGKTTIMKAIQQFYRDHAELDKFKGMAIMNANTLVDEQGDVRLSRLLRTLEGESRFLMGDDVTSQRMHDYMENATVCFDEVDKVPSRVGGKPNPMGAAIQHALLTIIEGERIYHETVIEQGGETEKVRFPVDTSRMLFICGGAFEDIYDYIFSLIINNKDDRKLREISFHDIQGRMHREFRLDLKKQIRLNDLFANGYQPQFISRFGAIAVLEDLKKDDMKRILLTVPDSPLRYARDYFGSMDIELDVTDEAVDLIADNAAKTPRIGARALREQFNRIVDSFKFDPYSSGKLLEQDGKRLIVLDRETVVEQLSR